MTTTPTCPVTVSDSQVRLALTVTSLQVVNYLTGVDPDLREGEALMLLDLGVELARRADQKADVIALDDVRQALAADVDAMRSQITASVDQLSRLAGSVTDRLDQTSEKAVRTVGELVGGLPAQVREVVEDATSDAELARVVSQVLTGAGSPIENLEKRLVAGLGQVKQSHDTALAAALAELSSAAGELGRVRGAVEERDRSPASGGDYEQVVENSLTAAAVGRGDVISDVRHHPGNGGSKKGDFLVEVPAEVPARVAVELKRTETGMSAQAAVRLVEEVATARDAHAVLIVCASHQGMPAGLRGGETLGLVGRHGLAVCHPPDGDPAILAVAYSLARTIGVSAAHTGRAGDFDQEAVNGVVDQVRQRVAAIRNVERALTRARNDINSQIKQLTAHRKEQLADLDTVVDELAKPSR